MPKHSLFRGAQHPTVRGRAPLRLGLAGGGTDLDPFVAMHGGQVLNVTIDKYCHASVQRRNLSEPIVRSIDLDVTSPHAEALELPEVMLHAMCLNRLVRDFDIDISGIELTTWADSPKGSGLGTSSTLVVAMLEALREFFSIPLNNYELAELAWSIERIDGKQQGGRQDQYAATFGGFNAIQFGRQSTIVNPLRLNSATVRELEASLILFYTGTSRVSSEVIGDQVAGYKYETPEVMNAAFQLKQDAFEMQEALVTGNLRDFGLILSRSWEAKKRTSRSVANEDIECAMQTAFAAGAEAGKVSGAGGGGFMMFYTRPELRSGVQQALNRLGFGASETCKFTKEGAVSWNVT